jgi:hypothetical protein
LGINKGKKVKTIPATLSRFTASPITEQKKRRVAGYARVSTDHDDQFTSYEAQIDYYTNYIKSRMTGNSSTSTPTKASLAPAPNTVRASSAWSPTLWPETSI